MKKAPEILFTFLGTMALAIALLASPTSAHRDVIQDNPENPNELSPPKSEEPHVYLQGYRRSLAGKPRGIIFTCDKYPTVCRAKGSSSKPDCCYRKCVNVMTDKLNCGKCGKKCKYSEMCCRGKCVNPSRDERHCGRCDNMCKKGSSCIYGLCGYA